MAASQTAKLLIQRGAGGRLRCASDPEMEGDRSGDRGDCEGDRISVLVESLVVVGRRLGVLNIEKYVAALDLADQVAIRLGFGVWRGLGLGVGRGLGAGVT